MREAGERALPPALGPDVERSVALAVVRRRRRPAPWRPLAVRRLPEPDAADRPARRRAGTAVVRRRSRPDLGCPRGRVSRSSRPRSWPCPRAVLGTGWVLAYVVVATPVCALPGPRRRPHPAAAQAGLVLPATGAAACCWRWGSGRSRGSHTDVLRAGRGAAGRCARSTGCCGSCTRPAWASATSGSRRCSASCSAGPGSPSCWSGPTRRFLVFALPALVVAAGAPGPLAAAHGQAVRPGDDRGRADRAAGRAQLLAVSPAADRVSTSRRA